MQSDSLRLLSQQKPSALKRAFAKSVEPKIQGTRERAIVRYVFEHVMLMEGGIVLDGIKWFHDRQQAIADAIGDKLRNVQRSVPELRGLGLIASQPRWRTEKGSPRRVSHWTLGQQVIDWLMKALDLAVASTADMAVDQPADVAAHGTANLAVPNKETLLPSTVSNPLPRVAAPAPQAPPEPTAEQPENRNEKGEQPEQPSPEKHGVRRREPRFDVMADRQKAEEAHQDTPVEQIQAGLALVRAMCSGLKPAHSA